MIKMSVTGIGLDAHSSQPIVLLEDRETFRTLPIWIGVAEARAISYALQHAKSERPMTHELLPNVIKELGYVLQQVEIDKLDSSTYRATLRLLPISPEAGKENSKQVDARPSDAIAAALAAGAPIFVTAQVLSNATVVLESQEHEEAQTARFKRFLKTVKASDFQLPGGPVSAPDDDTMELDELSHLMKQEGVVSAEGSVTAPEVPPESDKEEQQSDQPGSGKSEDCDLPPAST